jgi:hypothetical protein
MAIDRVEYRRAYYQRNREKAIAEAARWKQENREKANASSRKSIAKMRALDPEKFKERQKRWVADHPEKVKAIQAAWRKRHPDYWFQWRIANLKEWIVKSAKSNARQNGVPFSLTVEDIAIPDVCPALGIKLDVTARRIVDNSIALDRIVPEYGYVPTNVRIISRRANFIKNNATAEELEAIAAYIRRNV